MPNYKIVLFYNQYDQGFTETWYTQTTMTAGIFVYDPQWQSFFASAINFRGGGVSLVAARWSEIGNPRASYTWYAGAQFIEIGGTGQNDEPSAVDWLVKVNVSDGSSKHMYFRGLQASDVLRDPVTGGPKPSARLLAGLNTYMLWCNSLGLCIQRQQTTKENGALVNAQVIYVRQNLVQTEQSDVVLYTAPVMFGPPPYYVRFSNVPKNDMPGFPRNAPVQGLTVLAPFYVTVPWRYRANNSASTFPQNMRCIQLNYLYPAVGLPSFANGKLQSVNFLSRKTGRAFFVPRGRSRAVVTRR